MNIQKQLNAARIEGSAAWSADIPISENPYNSRDQRPLADAWGQGWSQSAHAYRLNFAN